MAENEYLEHYGRLGMKWYQHRFGDYQGQAKYAEKYKEKETAKIEKRDAKAEKKYEKRMDKARTDEKKEKITRKYESYMRESRAELNKIKNYRVDDILKEASYVNQKRAKVLMTNLVNVPLAAFGSPAYIVTVPLPGFANKTRTQYRKKGWGDLRDS